MTGRKLAAAAAACLLWLVTLDAGSAFAAESVSPHGDLGISHPTIVLVEWSPSDWPSYPFNDFGYQFGELSDGTGVEKFFADLTHSNYANMLVQYTVADDGTVKAIGAHADEFTVAGVCHEHDSANGQGQTSSTRLTDPDFQAVIENCIAAHSSDPAFQPTDSTVYLLYLPEGTYATVPVGTDESGDEMPENACGYHAQLNLIGGGHMRYAVIDSPAGNVHCTFGSTFERSVFWIQAHELFEDITDPDNTGWFSADKMEVADLCQGQSGGNVDLNGTTYVLPKMWSIFYSFIVQRLVQGCEFGTDFAQISTTMTGTKGTSVDPGHTWFTSGPVKVTWDVSPSDVAIRSGCATTTLSGNTPMTTIPCVAQGSMDAAPVDGTVGVGIDKTPPSLGGSIPGSPFLKGQSFSDLVPSASDATSGIAATPAAACGPITTAAVGSFTDLCHATNGAGLATTKNTAYKVVAVTTSRAKDGGFESPAEPNPQTTISAPGTIGPWSVTAGAVNVVQRSVWRPAAGNQSIDLAASATGTISQTFTLPATGTYDLDFEYAGNPLCGPAEKQMVVVESGATQPLTDSLSFDTTGHTTSSMGWQLASDPFLGAKGQTVEILFRDTTGSSCGMALDSVSVKGA